MRLPPRGTEEGKAGILQREVHIPAGSGRHDGHCADRLEALSRVYPFIS